MINVFSCFDGIACGYEAFKKAGIKVRNYFASEIDLAAIRVAHYNHPGIIHIGDITEVDFTKYKNIDIVIGGSPCTNVSRCGKREGLSGDQSRLFWSFVKAIETIKPKYFFLENVASMSEESKGIITMALGVEPILIDSALFSAQHRERLYWTNIPVKVPEENKDIHVKDIIARDYESEIDKVHFLNRPVDWIPEEKLKRDKILMPLRIGSLSGLKHSQSNRVYSLEGKTVSLVANSGGSGGKTGLYKIDTEDGYILRKLLPIECERAQTLPDNYTKVEGISNTQRYKMINNGWTVDVIAYFFRELKGVL